MENKTNVVVATHNGIFHADDVFAVAIIKMYYNAEVIRTRDPKILAKADFRVDVGGKNCVETGDFDHHQVGGGGKRDNGIPYSSCGLV